MLVSSFLKVRLKESLNCQTLKKAIKQGNRDVVSWHAEEQHPIFDSSVYSANLAVNCGLPEVLEILLQKGYPSHRKTPSLQVGDIRCRRRRRLTTIIITHA